MARTGFEETEIMAALPHIDLWNRGAELAGEIRHASSERACGSRASTRPALTSISAAPTPPCGNGAWRCISPLAGSRPRSTRATSWSILDASPSSFPHRRRCSRMGGGGTLPDRSSPRVDRVEGPLREHAHRPARYAARSAWTSSDTSGPAISASCTTSPMDSWWRIRTTVCERWRSGSRSSTCPTRHGPAGATTPWARRGGLQRLWRPRSRTSASRRPRPGDRASR